MLSVPFSVITLLALLFLLVVVLFSGKREPPGTLFFLIACLFLLSLNTLRWEYESTLLKQVQAACAAFLPSMTWHCFVSLTQTNKPRYLFLLLAPAMATILIEILWPAAIDFMLFLLFCSYGIGLIRMAMQGENTFTLSRLSESSKALRMTFFAGCFLCFSALADLAVGFDFSVTGGKQAPTIIAFFQALLLPLIGFAIVSASRTTSEYIEVNAEEDESLLPPVASSHEQEALYITIEERVRETQIYLNPNLTLNLLARKMGIPARQLSGAINAIRHCNVSQWINSFRIERAQELLRETLLPVTEVMLESGFSTKSNFNREFQRISGLSPTAFRQQARDNPEMNSKTH